MTTLLLVLLGCWGRKDPFEGPPREPSPTFSDPALDATGAGAVFPLWRIPATYSLPATTLPEGFTSRDTFSVAIDPDPVGQKKLVAVYEGPSPFREDLAGRQAAPPGMTLLVGDQEVRYHRNLQGKSWAIREGKILVAWDEALDPGQVRVRYDGAMATLKRRDLDTSGLSPEAFVRYQVTLAERTRQGMLLPAPARASWTLPIPAQGAVFDAHVALAPSPLRGLRSDGADAVVEVEVGGQRVEVARVSADADATTYTPLQVDLAPWAGQEITLHLVSDPAGNNHLDHLFWGSPTVWERPSGEPRRVIVIGLDTTRPDHFGFYGYSRDTTPELDAIAAHATVFDNAFTPAPRTRPSFRSATTGRRPLDAVGAKNIGEVFSEHGFATTGIVANIHLQPRFDFHVGFDDWWYDGGARAETQVDRALDFLDRYRERDVYMFLHIMDPHLYYNAPGSYLDMFAEQRDGSLPDLFSREEVLDWMKEGKVSDVRKHHIEARYDGELRYTSAQLGRFFDQLDRLGGRTLVVVHNDHGEEFWEHGGFEHNHTLYQETTQGLLWMRSNGGQVEGRRVSVPATLADIAPTLYDFAGFADRPPTDGISLRPFLEGDDGASQADRPIGQAHLRYGMDRWGVVYQGKKYVLHTASGTEELYDLAADPLERDDLSRKVDLEPWRRQLGPVHDMPVGPGWRLHVDLQKPGGRPFHLDLPRPARAAVVVPPSMTIPNPRNQAWGEKPRREVSEVGEVSLSEDGLRVTWAPGTSPHDGVLFVLFDEPVSPDDATLLRGDARLDLVRTTVWTWTQGDDTIRITPGTVFVPPPSEAERMRAMNGEASPAEIAQLCALGYLEGEICGDAPTDDAHGDH